MNRLYEELRQDTLKQTDSLKALAKNLGIQPNEVFYNWIYGNIKQIGEVPKLFTYFFHGLDCKITFLDNSVLELSFAAKGHVGGFTLDSAYFKFHEKLNLSKSELAFQFRELEANGRIVLPSYELFEVQKKLIESKKRNHQSDSIDVQVADRFIIK